MASSERTKLLANSSSSNQHRHHQGGRRATNNTDTLSTLFERPISTAQVRPELPEEASSSREQQQQQGTALWVPLAGSIDNVPIQHQNKRRTWREQLAAACAACAAACCHLPINTAVVTQTLTGSTIFLIYHVVFCLAQAAVVTRPHATHLSTGLLAQTAALGVVAAGPVFVFQLGHVIPAIYPASDLFLAPFLAQLAERLDSVLASRGLADNDEVFLATFVVAMGLGLFLSGGMCIAAARFKLANLGAFLPYSVLCGFFTTIGILIWTLGFSVDTGMKVGQVWEASRHDSSVLTTALLHHAPSLAIGIIMHLAGRAHPNWVMAIIVLTVMGSYVILWATNTTLEQAQDANWFFSGEDLLPPEKPLEDDSSSSFVYAPPLPLGAVCSLWRGRVVWEAVAAGIPTILALAFLYMIRCSLHSAALRKNIPNLTRNKDKQHQHNNNSDRSDGGGIIVAASSSPTSATAAARKRQQKKQDKEDLALGNILESGYGYSQLAAAVFGGITVAPSVAASLTMFKLGAESTPPQYGSFVLLIFFYFNNFQLVQYIPKPAFSCLMVLAGIDMLRSWIVGSFFKTKDKIEWMVAPILVVLAFSVGVLNAIFLGVAASTFIFAANFYRAGTVKFVGTGLTLRSTVERGPREAGWLDTNADLIQILVLQNYLFFGNAQSVLNYVTTMFDDDEEDEDNNLGEVDLTPIPPIPKFLIIDFAMVNGMDTSSCDLFHDVVSLCKDHKCALLLAGTSQSLRSMLLYAGITSAGSSNTTSYIGDLETALARAEDGLLSSELHLEESARAEMEVRQRSRSASNVEDGFLYALRKIDELHGLNVTEQLEEFRRFTQPVELSPGDVLARSSSQDGQQQQHQQHPGVYFVETGLMRVRHATGYSSTMSMTTTSLLDATSTTSSAAAANIKHNDPTLSIGHLDARAATIGRQRMAWKQEQSNRRQQEQQPEQSLRLARIGQGWVIGSIEASSGQHDASQGIHVAISNCRLHHLSYEHIQYMEKSKPTAAMNLYKLLSLLATKRQAATIRQLDQFVKIMDAPTPRLRGGKRELAKLQQFN